MADDQPTTLADDFGVAPKIGSTNRGLARRLVDGTLRPQERVDYELVEQIVALEEEGKSYVDISALLNKDVRWLRTWAATDKFRLFRRYFSERSQLQDDVQETQRRRQERRRWDSNGSKALDYFDQAFRRHMKDNKKAGVKQGDFLDLDRAERAAKLVAGARGWLEPVPTHVKPKDLTPGVIQAQMRAMRAADQREMVVRVTVGDATVEVGTREARETAKGEEIG